MARVTIAPGLPLGNISTMSKVLLLISSPVKEEELQFGVKWEDQVEAIPATYAVAFSRCNTLVALFRIIEQGQFGHLMSSLLFSMFNTPSPWLPEIVGSVLLLLGQKTCHIYLQHFVRQVTTNDVCTLKYVSTAVTRLALMNDSKVQETLWSGNGQAGRGGQAVPEHAEGGPVQSYVEVFCLRGGRPETVGGRGLGHGGKHACLQGDQDDRANDDRPGLHAPSWSK